MSELASLCEGCARQPGGVDGSALPFLRGVASYSSSGNAVLARDDGDFILADIRHVMAVHAGQAVSLPGEDRPLSLRLHPSPSLDMEVSTMACSPCGYFVAVAGTVRGSPELSRLAVLRLAGAAARHRTQDGASRVDPVIVDADLYASRPGLRVVQLAWHPGSEVHLAVLTNDSAWRLYSIEQPAFAEQTFELSLGRGGLGLLDSTAAPSAFAFGPSEGWDALCVYFLSTRGQIYRLCPVVPSGMRLPSSVWQDVKDADEDDPVSVAWIQQAFHEDGRAVPHVMQGHGPALVGPLLSLASHDAWGAAASDSFKAEDLVLVRHSSGYTAVLAAASTGTLLSGLLLSPALPVWQEARPQVLLAERSGKLLATRYQVGPPPIVETPPTSIGVMDLIRLPSGGGTELAGPRQLSSDDDQIPGRSVKIVPDTASPEQVYIVHRRGCHVVQLCWLPALAEASTRIETPPRPSAACLFDCSAAGVTDACLVGDALCGTALLLVPAEGEVRLLRASDAADALLAAQQQQEEQELPQEGSRSNPVVSELDTLSKPPHTPPRSPAVGAQADQRLAAEAAALRESHIEYAHRAHHEIMETIESLTEEASEQTSTLGRLQETLRGAENRAGALQDRLDAALKLQDLLNERCALLGSLYRETNLGLAASEGQAMFVDQELPRLEAESRAARPATESILQRVSALTRQGRSLSQVAAGKAALDQPLSQEHLRQLRQALVKQETRIGRAVTSLSVLETAVANAAH